MNEILIGRKWEQQQLQRCLDSDRSEFVVIYGRRRVGKTFLVRQFFKNNFTFSYVGAHHFTQREQLANFAMAIKEYGKMPITPKLSNWIEAFEALKELIKAMADKGRIILFFDEMPWIDNTRLAFVKALENFWNGWVVTRNDIVLIACGSSTSWMMDKLVMNKGGLHNRITVTINLRPFNLLETEQYLTHHGFAWNRHTIVECYMILGGVPFYLSKLDCHEPSLAKNIDILFFGPNAILRNEFDELYQALFAHADKYITIVRALANHREGLTVKQIAGPTGITGGWLTRILENLLRSEFVITFTQYGNKNRDKIFRLCDFLTLFWLKYVENDSGKDVNFWSHSLQTPSLAAWRGVTFELVVLLHLQQVKIALGIDRILNSSSSWRSKQSSDKTQIDLVIERSDRIINLCEIKFCETPYIITKEYAMRLRTRMAIFQNETKSRKSLVNTLITTYGLVPGAHAAVAQSEVVMDDLFVE